MKFTYRIIFAMLIAMVWAVPANTADAYDEFRIENVRYDARFPDPDSFLGHRLGEAPVRHHMLVSYFETIAAMSDRISIEIIGYSHERRPILFLVITSPENHTRLDDIQKRHIALTDPDSNQRIRDDMPVVTWLNYGVHGAEASGMDAALPTLYHLAAAQGPEIEELLENSVILMTAIFNPDGHSRRAAWFDQNLALAVNTDRSTRLHNAAWPGARTNHYWFDLNRQWLLLTQPESRAWVAKWHEWRPNLSIDYHEMGSDSTYYFHPGVASRTYPLVPDEVMDLMAEFSEHPAEFMDSEARLYYGKESFDNFYIGKGSTYPLMNGAVGILYEAGNAGGGVVETVNGLKSYRDNIRTHFRTSITSVEGALALRIKLLDFQKRFYADTIEIAESENVKAYVFSANGDQARMHHFLDLLARHRIEAFELRRGIAASGQRFEPGDAYIVPMDQPQIRMIKALFETITEFEDTTFYDISSWTMPFAFNLDYAALGARLFKRNLLGGEAAMVMPVASPPTRTRYAYMFSWDQYYAPRALNRLLSEGVLAKVATREVEITTTSGIVTMLRGSIMVPLENQTVSATQIFELMQQAASEDAVTVHAVTSGRATGQGDLGGPSFRALEMPKTLMVVGDGVSAYNAGEIWHLLDFRMNMSLTMMDQTDLGSIDWARYSHIIFPGGSGVGLDEQDTERLKQWVEEGGSLIGMRQGALWINQTILNPVNSTDEEADKEEIDRKVYGGKDSDEAIGLISGTIFRGDLDITHPIGFGYPDRELAVHRDTNILFERPENPYATVFQYDENDPLLSGYASRENRDKLAGTAGIIAERKGSGSIILYADNMNFRGIWYGTNKLFLNSLFFSKAFDHVED